MLVGPGPGHWPACIEIVAGSYALCARGYLFRRTFFHKNSMFGARLCALSPPTPTRALPNPTQDLTLSSSSSGCFHLPSHCTSSICSRLPSPPYRPLEYPGLPAQPESTSYDPSESSRHPIRVRVSGPVYHPSQNTVVIEFGSESAAQSILHRNPVDIEFGSPARDW